MSDNIRRIDGGLDIYTNGSRVSLTNGASPLSPVQALFHIVNDDAVTCGLRRTSYCTGSTAAPYQNNDNSLWEVFNNSRPIAPTEAGPGLLQMLTIISPRA